MRLHELHSSLIHAPMALLPAAAAFDLAAALKDDRALGRAGRILWWAGSAGAVAGVLSGLAASQEVKIYEPSTKDALVVHGAGNALVTIAALALAGYRSSHKPTVNTAMIGLTVCAAAVFTAYLGGEMVYARGVGVKPAGGVHDSPNVLSLQAPVRFVQDVVNGLGWVVREVSTWARRPPVHALEVGNS